MATTTSIMISHEQTVILFSISMEYFGTLGTRGNQTTHFLGVEIVHQRTVTDRKERPMSEFKNVTVVKKANVYFNGNVNSRTVLFADGSKKTLGVMLPGDYEFNTAAAEIMEIMSGDLEILLPGAAGWKNVKGGETFEVPAKSKFSLKVKTLTDYCCSFIS
jgi:uncharacterized protein YaiE (UPF0345 family)